MIYDVILLRTGAVSWTKPRSLGMHDVDAENVWLAMHRAQFTYYYNPLSMDMSWDIPPGTLVCNKCETEFGRCYVLEEERAYCTQCYYDDYAFKDPEASFKKISGGVPGVVGMNFHMLPDTTWQTAEW